MGWSDNTVWIDAVKPKKAWPTERYVTCIPLVPLKAAAGAFSDPQHIEDDGWEWTAVDTKHRLRPGMFVAQVVGKSMEPVIPMAPTASSPRPSPARGRARPCSSNCATPPTPRRANATP